MPIKVIRVDIFISSPSDVAEERKIIRRVIEHLNRSSLRDSFFLVPLLYEDEVPPQIGKEAQLIVDRYIQVQRSYILVSLLWTRMGTPFTILETNERYESGTQYEILKGYENFQAKGQPHILLYKKEKENPNADSMQKAKVEDFFNSFLGDPPRMKGLFARYTDLDEFEAKIEEHLRKLLQTYPPPLKDDSLVEAPEFEEEPRRIDAAMPRQTGVGQSVPVQMMICLPESDGLKAFLPDAAQNKYEVEKKDVRAGGLTIAFPKDKKTGKLRTTSVIVEIETRDFKVDQDVKKVQVSPGLDSGLVTFSLTPLYARPHSVVIIRVKSTSLDGGEIECGSVVLYTEIKATKDRTISQALWGMVSYSLKAASSPNAFPQNLEEAEMEKGLGNAYNFSDFRGSAMMIESRLTDASQNIDHLTNLDRRSKDELKRLIEQLRLALSKIPAEQVEHAERIVKTLRNVIKDISSEKPDKTLLQIVLAGFRKAAENMTEVSPEVLPIALEIEAFIRTSYRLQ